ncbi:MAG TPA: nitrilase-related carbon-nitrogen hydrolase, partial [Steroidobacteraceae bacterium]
MKVAAVQMTSGADVADNLDTARALLEEAQGAAVDLAVLPENFAFMGLRDADKLAIGEAEGQGPIQDFLAATARRLKMWIIAGTIPLKVPGDARVAAASLVFDARGTSVGRYDKIHLFDVEIPERSEKYRESANMAPGTTPRVVDTPVGRVGLAVCYDVRFPELFRNLSAGGAELFVLPSAFT